jgi:hypothetical protein
VKTSNLTGICLLAAATAGATVSSAQPVVLERDGSTVALEAYAPNVVRVTLSLERSEALAPPGYGFVATPQAAGWTHEKTKDADVYRSARLVVTVAVNRPGTPLDTQKDIARFFNGSAPPADVTFATPEGRTLLHMTGWQMSATRRSWPTGGRPTPRSSRSAPRSTPPTTSTTTASASTRRAVSTTAATPSTAGTTTSRRAARASACRSW